MVKLRINPIVAEDLRNIREYIAEDNEELAVKTIRRYMRELRTYSNFRTWELILLRESASGQIINM